MFIGFIVYKINLNVLHKVLIRETVVIKQIWYNISNLAW